MVSSEVLTRALGEELRRVREDRGWSQSELARWMPTELHVKTLATYEQGIRQCTVVRLVEICRTLGVAAADVLSRAQLHMAVDLQKVGLEVDLHAVAGDTRSELRLLRRWARNRLANNPACGVVHLIPGALQEMAAVLGLTVAELVHQLEMYPAVPTARLMKGGQQ